MHNAGRVGGVQGIGDLRSQVEQLIQSQRLAFDAMLEGLPFQQLHSDEVIAIGFVNFIDSANVRMVKGRGRACFSLKTLDCLRIAGKFFRQELQGDETPQLEVFSLVHDPHAPAAQFFYDSIMGDCTVDHIGLIMQGTASAGVHASG